MITTVTPNPSMDRTLHLTTFTRGAVNRVHRVMVEPSGKGINVALALQTVGRDVTAVLPVGGPSGRALIAMLDAAGLAHRDVPITGAIRTNVSLVEADGTTSKVNEPGPEVSAKDIDDLIAAALTVSSVGEWVAWCGSLPTGFGESMLADALAHTHSVGRRVALDSSGSALRTALDLSHDQLPHLIKPNADELADSSTECSPRWLTSRMQQLSWFAAAWKPYWSAWVETRAILVNGQVALHVKRRWRVVNTVGAGDAFLAGYLSAIEQPVDQRLTWALRFGATAVQHHGTLVSQPDPSQPVEVHTVDRTRRLPASTP